MHRYKKRFAQFFFAIIFLINLKNSSSAGYSDLEALEKKITEGCSLADLISYAFITNPSIQGAREAWKGVIERYRVVTAHPDPMLMTKYFPDPIGTRLEIEITQSIPFPGKLAREGYLKKADANIAKIELDRIIKDVIAQIRESYFELLYIRDAKRILAQNLELLEHLRKLGETAYVRDWATLVDVLKAQSQLSQLQYDAILLEELEKTEKTRLNSLINRPPDAPIGPIFSEPLNPIIYRLEEIYDIARKNADEIRIAEKEVERSRVMLGLAMYENLPEFKLGLMYEEMGAPPMEAGRNTVGVQAGISIPLWIGKNRGRLEEARSEVKRAESLKSQRMNETLSQIRNVYFRVKNSERLVELYRDKLLPQALRSMEIAETWYREGQGSLSDFIELQSVYYNFQLSLARARADYGKYLAQLERLSGTTVTKREERGSGEAKP